MVAPLALMGVSAAADAVNGLVDAIGSRTGGAKGAASATATKFADKTKKTADDFEKMFLEQSLDRLAQSTGDDGPLGENGTGGAVYKSMLMKEFAGSIVKSGGVGISSQIYDQMLKMQESARV